MFRDRAGTALGLPGTGAEFDASGRRGRQCSSGRGPRTPASTGKYSTALRSDHLRAGAEGTLPAAPSNMKALIIKKHWADEILSGRKTWELRGSRTSMRGRIGVIESGSGHVIGTCELIDVIGPLSTADLRRATTKHQVPSQRLRHIRYKRTYAWVLRNARRYARPRRYEHPQGAVIWVNL